MGTIDYNKALQFFRQCIDEIDELMSEKDETSNKYEVWKAKTETLVAHVFGETSPEYKGLQSLFHPLYACMPHLDHIITRKNNQSAYINRLQDIRLKLQAYMKLIELKSDFETTENKPHSTNSFDEVVRICKRFPNVVRHIQIRHSQRPSIEVNDEYDVQYLLEILLAVSFDDIRQEEPAPSFAGTTSRIDFLLKDEGIAIETKMTRKGLADKELTKQLIQDIAQYQTHPDVSFLICFIYDPDKYVRNPFGLIKDLESKGDKLKIKVVISPL